MNESHLQLIHRSRPEILKFSSFPGKQNHTPPLCHLTGSKKRLPLNTESKLHFDWIELAGRKNPNKQNTSRICSLFLFASCLGLFFQCNTGWMIGSQPIGRRSNSTSWHVWRRPYCWIAGIDWNDVKSQTVAVSASNFPSVLGCKRQQSGVALRAH